MSDFEATPVGTAAELRRLHTENASLHAALEQPDQRPVAWTYQNSYTNQEYLVWKKGTGGRNWTPLYTAPPQRKPLTEEEIGRIAGDCLDAWSCARAIEQAHGIKE